MAVLVLKLSEALWQKRPWPKSRAVLAVYTTNKLIKHQLTLKAAQLSKQLHLTDTNSYKSNKESIDTATINIYKITTDSRNGNYKQLICNPMHTHVHSQARKRDNLWL